MKKPERQVSFKGNGKDWTLEYNFGSLVQAERHFDASIQKVVAKFLDADNVRLGDLCDLIRFGLIEHHPDITEDEVAELVQDVGLNEVVDKVGEAFQKAFSSKKVAPKDEPGDEEAAA